MAKVDTYFVGEKETCGYCNQSIYNSTPVSVDGVQVYHRPCWVRFQKLLERCK